MPKPRSRAQQAPVATPEQPVRSVSRRPPEASPYWQHAATKLPPLTPPRSQSGAAYAPINGVQSPAPGFGREGDEAAAAAADKASMSFLSPPRREAGNRHSQFVFSPSSAFPKSPIPLFVASPDRKRHPGPATRPNASPGMLFDPLLSQMASPMGVLLPSSSDLPAPGLQIGGVPRGFGSPKDAGSVSAEQAAATGDLPGAARRARRRFSFGEPLCGAAVTRQHSAPAPLMRDGSGVLRGEHRAAATLSRLVETASMHAVPPPAPPSSDELLQLPPALQLDSVALPAPANGVAAAAAESAVAVAAAALHDDAGPTPRSAAQGRSSRRAAKAAAAEEDDGGVPVRASTWSTLMEAVATTPGGRRLSTSTSGGKGSMLSVLPPGTPDEAGAGSNPRRQSTASSMLTTKHCHCKKSKCLKLYCDCFAAGLYCNNCNCASCANTLDNEEAVSAARKVIEERNPDAFKAKIVATGEGAVAAAHRRGCHCKKSGCKKKYCECFQAGAPCGKACKCDNCQNQPPPGTQPPEPAEDPVSAVVPRRASASSRGGSRAKPPAFASPATPSVQARTVPVVAAETPSATASLTGSGSTASGAQQHATPPPPQPQRPPRQRRHPSPQPALPAGVPVRQNAMQQDLARAATPPVAESVQLPEAPNVHISRLAPAATAPEELDTMLLTGAEVASTGAELRHAGSAPPGTLPPVAPSLPPGLPAGSRMVDTADGPMMLVPILPPGASRSDGGAAQFSFAAAAEGSAAGSQEALVPMIWHQLPGGRLVQVPMHTDDGEQMAFMVSPAAEGEHSNDATQHAPTPSTLFASLAVDASGNLTASTQPLPAAHPAGAARQGGGDFGASPLRRLASPTRGRFFLSSPIRGFASPMRGMVQFTEVDGEEDLQALLGAAADFQEAGNDTSRHSLDTPVGYEFEAGDLSQSPAQENVQGSQEPPAAAAAAAELSAPPGGAASPPQPEKPLSDITATADSPHRGKGRRQPCSPTASGRSGPAPAGRSTPSKRKRDELPARSPLWGRFAAVAQALDAAQPAPDRHTV